MKILFKMLLISLCLTSFSFAQEVSQQNDDHKVEPNTIKKKKKVESYILVERFLINSGALDLPNSQRRKLDKIKQDYLYTMIQKEADFQISEMKVMDLLKETDFDPEKVKKAIEVSINLTLENALMSIDALAAIREVVGFDNFNKLRGMVNLMPSDMKKNKYPTDKNQDSFNEQI